MGLTSKEPYFLEEKAGIELMSRKLHFKVNLRLKNMFEGHCVRKYAAGLMSNKPHDISKF